MAKKKPKMEYMNWEELKRFWRIEIMGGEHKKLNPFTIYRRIRKKEQRHYLFWFRLAQHLHRRPKGALDYKKLAKRIRTKLVRTYSIDIMLDAEIGPGISFAHLTSIVIAGAARIGSNLYIRQNTTIGIKESGQTGLIHIGNNVNIGANACIIGNDLRIGDNVTIGAMAFINRDIPANSIYYTQYASTTKPKNPEL